MNIEHTGQDGTGMMTRLVLRRGHEPVVIGKWDYFLPNSFSCWLNL